MDSIQEYRDSLAALDRALAALSAADATDASVMFVANKAKVHLWASDVDGFRANVRAAKAVTGRLEKDQHAELGLVLTGEYDGVEIRCMAYSDLGLCQKVEVGTRTVERRVPVGEVEYVTETVEEPVYEYVCPPSLLADSHDREQVPA